MWIAKTVNDMTIAITYITLGILYLLACIADGQDVKPLWKRWLGCKLEGWADNLKPIDYCNRSECKYWQSYQLNDCRTKYEIPQVRFDAEKIESRMVLTENELFRARMVEDEARRHGMPLHLIPRRETVDGMIDDVKKHCMNEILKLAQSRIDLEVRKDDCRGEIVIDGVLYVGRN